MALKVLWIIDSLGPGGAEGLMLPLLKNMDGGMVTPRVCVLRVRDGNPIAVELAKINVPVDLVPIKNLRDISGFKRLVSYIHAYQPDIVHTQLETSDIFGTLAAKYLKIPSVSTVHTLDVPSKKRRTYWRNLFRWIVLRLFSKRVIAVSEITRQLYASLGIRGQQLVTLYNGIDLSVFSSNNTRAAKKKEVLNLSPDSIVLTTIAVLREPKGIQYMLKALPELIKVTPNLFYVIVGDGSYRGSLEDLSRTLGVEDHVRFLGHRTDVPEILSACDLFVFPTLQDALPTVLFEAMAANLPIVASYVGGVPEILQHEQTGILIPPADPSELVYACLRLLRDDEFSYRMSVSAGKIVKEKFDIIKQIQNLSNLYSQVVLES